MAPGSVAVACLLLLHGALGNTIASKRRQLKLLRPQKTVRRGGSDGQAAEPGAAAAAPDAAVDAASDAPDAQTAASATPVEAGAGGTLTQAAASATPAETASATPAETASAAPAAPPQDFDAAAAAARAAAGADAAALAAAAEAAASLPPARPHSEHDHLSARELAAVIVADLTPHGMLPLAWAAAAGGGTGWVPAVALLGTFGAASTYTLFLAARVSEAAGGSPAPALSTLWRLARLPGARCVDGGVAVLCGGCCVFYAAFAADLFHALAARAGFAASRAAVLAALLVAPLSPLCLGDDLSVLKYSSYAGLAGVAYTSVFLARAGAAAALPVPALRVGAGTAVLANTLVVAFLCHYNALQYYQELEPAERSPRTYAKSAGAGALATAVVFGCTLFGGVAAFGGAALPNVLNNFGDTGGAALARLGTGVAILSGFPLMFAGLKVALDGAAPAWVARRDRRAATHVALLAAVGAAAAKASEDDVGLIIELLGSTLGVAAVYVVPGLAAARSAALPPAHKAAGGAVAAAGSLLAVGGSLLTYKTHAKH